MEDSWNLFTLCLPSKLLPTLHSFTRMLYNTSTYDVLCETQGRVFFSDIQTLRSRLKNRGAAEFI